MHKTIRGDTFRGVILFCVTGRPAQRGKGRLPVSPATRRLGNGTVRRVMDQFDLVAARLSLVGRPRSGPHRRRRDFPGPPPLPSRHSEHLLQSGPNSCHPVTPSTDFTRRDVPLHGNRQQRAENVFTWI